MSDDLTKDELKEQAREAGLPISGTKDELKERLAEADAPEAPAIGTAVKSPASIEAERMGREVYENGPIQYS
jgi:hypothetical protein